MFKDNGGDEDSGSGGSSPLFIGPPCFLPDSVLERLVGLVHWLMITSEESLLRDFGWRYKSEYVSELYALLYPLQSPLPDTATTSTISTPEDSEGQKA